MTNDDRRRRSSFLPFAILLIRRLVASACLRGDVAWLPHAPLSCSSVSCGGGGGGVMMAAVVSGCVVLWLAR
jgi:hypothetical protein